MELVLQLVCSVKKKTVDSRILFPYLPGHVGCQGIENSLSAFLFLFFFPSSFFFKKRIIIMGRRPLLPSKNRGRGFGENGNHSW
jgi:hypothetical protein